MKWSDYMMEGSRRVGCNLDSSRHFAKQLTEAGFTNVHETIYKWPWGSWPKGAKEKLLGRWVRENFQDGIQGFSMAFFSRALGWSKEAVEVFLIDVRKDMRDKKKHVYLPIRVVYGQKPDDVQHGQANPDVAHHVEADHTQTEHTPVDHTQSGQA
ncbi:MAG: hypothetical protein M1827_001259 [Pycnora praestabilis]|nr:MAG: hypothetical protein M1827_001259 [Pycnora praestabilis]